MVMFHFHLCVEVTDFLVAARKWRDYKQYMVWCWWRM